MTSRTFARVLNFLALLTFVGIGGLQMYRVDLGWVTSYGADILLPALLYFWFRQGTTIVNWNRLLGARPAFFLVLSACAMWEWSQAYNFEGTPLAIAGGTFDPMDFVAYLLGLIAAVAVEARIEKGNQVPGSSPEM